MLEIVVMACFDENTSNIFMNYRKDLTNILNKEMAGEWIPHITLGCYIMDENIIQELISWIRKIANNTEEINIEFNSIGTFFHTEKYPDTNVIYAAPAIPEELYSLYSKYHSKFDEYSSSTGNDYSMIKGQPTIHSTITMCDKNEYMKAINYMWENYKPIKSKINNIKIYKMNKELIESVDLKGGK